jgi:hypothetical protein
VTNTVGVLSDLLTLAWANSLCLHCTRVIVFPVPLSFSFLPDNLMASSEVPETLVINGHANSDIRNGENTGVVKLVNDSEHGISEIGLGESAQLEEPALSPVLVDDAASQPVDQSKNKPKRTVPTLQTASVKTGASGPPTPQVKKVCVRVSSSPCLHDAFALQP